MDVHGSSWSEPGDGCRELQSIFHHNESITTKQTHSHFHMFHCFPRLTVLVSGCLRIDPGTSHYEKQIKPCNNRRTVERVKLILIHGLIPFHGLPSSQLREQTLFAKHFPHLLSSSFILVSYLFGNCCFRHTSIAIYSRYHQG